jgi:K+-sensing histidine kinase KdpD
MGAASLVSMPLRPPKPPNALTGYGIAIAAVAIATLVRWPLYPVLGNYVPFATYFFAIAVTSWFAGWRPSLLSILLGFAAAAHWLVLPVQYERVVAITIAFTIYFLVGLLVAVVVEGFRYVKNEAESNADQLQTARDKVF